MKLIPDALIQFKDTKIHASEVDANVLGEIVKATGDYADMEFLDAKFLALTTRPGPGMVQAAEFLATSYDENEDEFLASLVYVSDKGVDFPGVPEFADKDLNKVMEFYDSYKNRVRESGRQRSCPPDVRVQVLEGDEVFASTIDTDMLNQIVARVSAGYSKFLDIKYLGPSDNSHEAKFLTISYNGDLEEYIVELVYLGLDGIGSNNFSEFSNPDYKKALEFFKNYEGSLVREAAETPQRTEDPRWFFTKEEIKGMLPGIEDRAVRWNPDTWSDETQDFAEDRGETVPELLDVLVSIQSMTINKAIETAIDYALDNEDEDYDYEGLDGELFGDGMTDGLSAIQTAALIYAAHFAYEGQVDDLNASREDTDEDEDWGDELQESVARESPFYAALERVGDDDIKEYIEGRLERELTPEAYRKVVKVFSDATETESVYEALHFVGDDPIKEYVEKGLKRTLGKKTFEIVETIFVESTTDDDDWGED